ncbi:vitamin K epoxide reductase family protein [Haloferula sp.]|uniref:vitamin K epoxide reductase family protein n=1 Tax=Haloferula sp. TaxID=2497595 RepID=UPI003C789511
MKKVPRIIVRILAALGLLVSVWLTWLKLSGQISSIAGCGAGSGCSNVLGSRWSEWFLMPVSLLSSFLYLGLLGLTFRPRSTPLFIMAMLLIGAAVWFMGLQVLVLKSFCPWCLASHLLGLSSGFVILFGLKPKLAKPGLPLATSAMILGILILGQIAGPHSHTHVITEEVFTVNSLSPDSESGQSPPDSALRSVSFFGGAKSYPVKELPHFGPVEAPHVVVEYFDYLCASCRDLHGDLKTLQATYPDQVTVICLPTPLDRACNPNMTPAMSNHGGACEIARMALAIWRIKPEAFEAIHNALFEAFPATPDFVRELILQQVTEEELEAALEDPWIENQLAANFADFARWTAKTPKMPKLLVKDSTMMHGTSSSAEAFLEAMSELLELEEPVR